MGQRLSRIGKLAVAAAAVMAVVLPGTAWSAPNSGIFARAFTVNGDETDETFVIRQSGADIVVVGPPGNQDPDGTFTACSVSADTTTVACPDSAVDEVQVLGAGGNDTIVDERAAPPGTADAHTLLGAAGNDTLTASPAATARVISLLGQDGNDTLTKNLPTVRLQGYGGDDVLNAGSATLESTDRGWEGNDTFIGGAGDDDFEHEGGDGADIYRGGGGRDSLSYGTRADGVTVTLAGGADDGGPGEGDDVTGVEVVTGGQGSDRLTGTDADEALGGGGGNDVLDGMGGRDDLSGGDGDDTLTSTDRVAGDVDTCGAGADTVFAENIDTVMPDCERVMLTEVSGPGAPVVGPDGPLVRIGSQGTVRRRTVTIAITCPGTAVGMCRGEAIVSARLTRRARRATEIGRRSFRARPGQRIALRVTLTRAAAARLADARRLSGTVKAMTRDDTGVSRTATRRVALIVR